MATRKTKRERERVIAVDEAVPPHDLELERAVLGHILLHPETFADYRAEGLESSDFYREIHRRIYDAIERLDVRDVPPEFQSVATELRARGDMEEIGPAYFANLIDGIVRSQNVGFYVRSLREMAVSRKLIERVNEAKAALFADPSSVSRDWFVNHVRSLEDVRKTATAETALLDSLTQMERHANYLEAEKLARLHLPWSELDQYPDGIRFGEVFGVTARPGVGKTIVLANLAHAFSNEYFGQIFFSLEMPGEQIVERLQRITYELPKKALRDGLSSGALDPNVYTTHFQNLYIDDTPSLSVAEMSNRITQAELGPLRGKKVGVVIVDHLGMVGGDYDGEYERISSQARDLKDLAKRHKVAVLLAFQPNRDTGGDGSKELHLGCARGSGVVEEICDYILAMRSPALEVGISPEEKAAREGVILAKFIKNRHGETGREIRLRRDSFSLRLKEEF